MSIELMRNLAAAEVEVEREARRFFPGHGYAGVLLFPGKAG